MDIFGFSIKRRVAPSSERSFVPPTDEGALDTMRAGGYYGTYLDLDSAAKNESEQIKRYREISLMADVDKAINDIVNEAIANLDNEEIVKLNLDKTPLTATVKKAVEQEFKNILNLMRFNERGYDYFRRWYIDGRIYFHKVIDLAKPKNGITDIRYIDPRRMRKIRNINKTKDKATGAEFIKSVEEFYMYSERGIHSAGNSNVNPTASVQGMKISTDAICYTPSGLFDADQNLVLSYLHKAVKPANQLRMMENALVIYRLARAPERRIFYIDVGNLPKLKAEQYVKDLMNRYRNKLVYDANTGEIRDDKKTMAMLEDFWLPRREGGKGTEIDTLPGGQNLGEIDDIEYFRRNLYEALNVPMSRLQQSGGLNFGRAAEITRDELEFTKFIGRLRKKFSSIFDDLLRTQLVLKGIVTEQDWKSFYQDIQYEFAQDAYYTESKEQEILRSRADLLTSMSQFIGMFYSKRYIQKHVLRLSDEDIEELEKEMAAEPPPPMMGGDEADAPAAKPPAKAPAKDKPQPKDNSDPKSNK